MAHLLIWPGRYFFYPIGNTSATTLTRDLSPDEPAHVLLLGCGDPRNILYTIHSEPSSQTRKLDFTCCDIDPGVLARNVLLFTMIHDGIPITTTIWNIFFHMYLDKDSHFALVQQCKKLISLSESSQDWHASPYGSFLRMCTDYTLQELRRHWVCYAEMHDLPPSYLKTICKGFADTCRSYPKTAAIGARSAGPVFTSAYAVIFEQFKHYLETGVTFIDNKSITNSTFLNPTFVYSLAGEGCFIHYGTDPMIPFHHAALFGNAKRTPTIVEMVKSAKASFDDWCSSFKTLSSRCVLRFFLGEATAVCASLGAFADTGSLDIGIPATRWKMSLIQLNETEYVSGSAPHVFNVIDTSNLEDHIGLLNVIISTVPLLSRSASSSTLYTESLIFRGQEDATKYFNERLYVDITVAALLFGVCPVDYLSSFSTHCNTVEIIMQQALKGGIGQFHRVTTWKYATSCDFLSASASTPAPIFDPAQLGSLLYDMYHTMFEQEDSMNFAKLNRSNLFNAILSSNVAFYSRETFVLMLKLIRKNMQMPNQTWLEMMNRFMALRAADSSMPMDSVNYNDLCAHLYRYSMYTVSLYRIPYKRCGIFSAWPSVPPVVRVFLTMPRSALSVMQAAGESIGTPILHCGVQGKWSYNIFSSIHTAFGRVTSVGTNSSPSVLFEEDKEGWKGTSSLVVSFAMSSGLLTDTEPQEYLSVSFQVRSTCATVQLVPKLGFELKIFSAKLLDGDHVIVIPEHPFPQPVTTAASPHINSSTRLHAEIGTSNSVIVQLDRQCKLVTSFTCKISLENDKVQPAFGAGETPQVAQVSPCVMRLTISNHKQDIVYPFPVVGSENKLRLARKSQWIEVVVPVSGPFKAGGMKLTPFPVIFDENHFIPWNIHRVNLSCLPVLNLKAESIGKWLNWHVGSMFSTRERDLREKGEDDSLMNVKDTLLTIFMGTSGIQGGSPKSLFFLHNKVTSNCDTIFFISDLKYDLPSHTVICDGYVLPLTHDIIPKLRPRFHHLISNAVKVAVTQSEMQAWKQLLPAFVERCRSSWSHGPRCEYKAQDKIPLTEELELDPLCSCGRGKDTEGMKKVALWREYAPYVTRVALSPLFAVSYLEPIGSYAELTERDSNESKSKCLVCHGKGKPKVMACGRCKKVVYCGSECQKKDWKAHKPHCKP